MSAVLVFLSGVVLVALIKLWQSQSPRYLSPLRHLRGPRSPNLLFGNFTQLAAPYQALTREWVNEYGPNFQVHGFLNVRRINRFLMAIFFSCLPFVQTPSLFTLDPKAIHHILTHTTDFRKPRDALRFLARLSGPGTCLDLNNNTLARVLRRTQC